MDATVIVVGALVGALFVGVSQRWPNAGRALFCLLFAGGATFNLAVTLPDAESMLRGLVAPAPLALYRDAVELAVAVSAPGFVLLVVAFEAGVAALTMWRGAPVKVGLVGAAAWLVAMLPAVPPDAWVGSTLAMGLMALSAALLARHDFEHTLPTARLGSDVQPL